MNKEWSELNKAMQLQIKKKETFPQGIETLLALRKQLMEQILEFKETLSRDDFSAMPFLGEDGFHSKTIAYSIWHIFRIEDIVSNTLIRKDE
ncbi:MAG: phage head-tail adapter protein, partial [Oscillospiraceae bacterium]|nr:phage head-tail adapter protein [Oscillospiraceae bacterium]